MKRLAKELEKSRQATTDTERRLRETIETHIRENHVFGPSSPRVMKRENGTDKSLKLIGSILMRKFLD